MRPLRRSRPWKKLEEPFERWLLSKRSGRTILKGSFAINCWDIIGESLVVFVQDLFKGKKLEAEVWFAQIVLYLQGDYENCHSNTSEGSP